MSTRIVVEDEESGETHTHFVEDDYLVICDGCCYIYSISGSSTSGKVQITIKKAKVT